MKVAKVHHFFETRPFSRGLLQKYRIKGLKQTMAIGFSRNCCTIAAILSFGG
ncbi:hypothetical protein [Fontibacillus sp. BL9]|uniref:hypothetical protein n=1 Tax=Fontibacillus sp. BL9 TaxID=3389971 RepID=UPI00397901F5